MFVSENVIKICYSELTGFRNMLAPTAQCAVLLDNKYQSRIYRITNFRDVFTYEHFYAVYLTRTSKATVIHYHI